MKANPKLFSFSGPRNKHKMQKTKTGERKTKYPDPRDGLI